jgi:hypothetical protein
MRDFSVQRAARVCAGLALVVATFRASAQQRASMPGMSTSNSADSGSARRGEMP